MRFETRSLLIEWLNDKMFKKLQDNQMIYKTNDCLLFLWTQVVGARVMRTDLFFVVAREHLFALQRLQLVINT